MKALSSSIRTLKRSGIRELMDLAFQREDVVRLEVGDPDFSTPEHIVEAAGRAARAGYTHYTPSRGLPEVRAAMAAKLRSFNHIEADTEDVVITAGGGHGLFSVFRALTNPGDIVLVPDPGWPNYRTIATLSGMEIRSYPLLREAGFLPDIDRLHQILASTSEVKALVVNSPANPTGTVWPKDTLHRVLELCDRHDIYLVSDECYEAIVFEGEHYSPASFEPKGRTISVFSLSKTYAMTGWRVGYVVGSRQVVDAVGKVVESSVSCAPAVSQKAAEAAITGDQSVVGEMVAAYRSRRDLALSRLEGAKLHAWPPRGAFYVMMAVPAEDTSAFVRELVTAEGVTVAPGQAFGSCGQGMVRLSLASDSRSIAEGIARISRFVSSRESNDPE